jgi:hypothetical protein
MGIMSLNSDGTFGPAGTVTIGQTIKMLLYLLGYKDIIGKSNGGAESYMSYAQQLKLLKGIKGIDINSLATKGTFAMVVCNSLDVSVLETDTITKDKKTFKKGNSLLYEKLKIYSGEGVLIGSKYAKYTTTQLENDEVEIDGMIFKVGKTNASDLFGYKLKFYYVIVEITDDKTILYMSLSEGKNNILYISENDVDSASTLSKIKYYDEKEDKDRTANIASDAKFLYNGRPLFDATSSDLKPTNGLITLYDTEGTGTYNIVSIVQYNNYIVDSINDEDRIIRFKERKFDSAPTLLDNSVELDEESEEYTSIIIRGGKDIPFTEISQGDVVSLSFSRGYENKLIIAWVSSVYKKGIIKEASEDKITIKDTEYEIDSDYKDSKIFQFDTEIVVYLDASGKIAYFLNGISSEFKYGYLVSAYSLKDMNKNAKFKIFDIEVAKGKMEIYKNAPNILVDGESRNSQNTRYTGEMVASILYKMPEYGMLIRYKINATGELSEVKLPKNCINIPIDEQDENDFRLNLSGDVAFGARLINQFRKSTATKYVFIPTNPNDPNISDVDYELSTTVPSYTYTSQLFNVSRALSPEIVVVKGVSRGTTLSNGAPVIIVSKIVEAINEAGESVLKLYGYTGGKETTNTFSDKPTATSFFYREMNVYVQDMYNNWTLTKQKTSWMFDKTYDKLKVGDMVQLLLDKEGNASSYRVVFDSDLLNLRYQGDIQTWREWDSGREAISQGYHYDSGLYMAYAKVVDIYNNNLVINPNSGEGYPSTWNQSFPIDKAKVYVYRQGTGKIENSTIGNILKGDYVVLHARSITSNVDIMIIK